MRPIIFIPQGIDALGFGLVRKSLELIVEEISKHRWSVLFFGMSCEEFGSSCNFVALLRNKLETVSVKERQ